MTEVYVIFGQKFDIPKYAFYRECKNLDEVKKYLEIAIDMSDFVIIKKMKRENKK